MIFNFRSRLVLMSMIIVIHCGNSVTDPNENASDRNPPSDVKIKFLVSASATNMALYMLSGSGDFYEYESSEDEWQQKANPPVEAETIVFLVGASTGVNQFAYILTSGGGFYEYQSVDDSWVERLSPPASAESLRFMVGSSTRFNRFVSTVSRDGALYEYRATDDSWTRRRARQFSHENPVSAFDVRRGALKMCLRVQSRNELNP